MGKEDVFDRLVQILSNRSLAGTQREAEINQLFGNENIDFVQLWSEANAAAKQKVAPSPPAS